MALNRHWTQEGAALLDADREMQAGGLWLCCQMEETFDAEPVACIYNELTAATKGQHLWSWSSWLYGEDPLNSPARSRHGLLSRESSPTSGDASVEAVKQTDANAPVHYKWKVGVNYWWRHLTCASSIPAVSIQCERVWLAAATKWQMSKLDAFTSFIHKMGFLFFFFLNILVITSYAQQIRRHTCSKPQTKFLRRRNPASHFKMAPLLQKSNPFTFVVQFHILKYHFTAISF